MLRKVSVAALGFVALASVPAFAMAPETLVVHVPFAFSVSDETLPAGDYRVRPMNDLHRGVLEIRSTDGRHALFAFSSEAAGTSRGSRPELIFDRYGKKEFLRAVRLPEEAGATLPASRSELEAAQALAGRHKARS